MQEVGHFPNEYPLNKKNAKGKKKSLGHYMGYNE